MKRQTKYEEDLVATAKMFRAASESKDSRIAELEAGVAQLRDACNGLLDHIRTKYGVVGNDFSCPHIRAIAEIVTPTESEGE